MMMKRCILFLLAGAGAFVWGGETAENMYGRQSLNAGFFAVPKKGPVTIDGDLSDWDLSGQIWTFSDIEIRNDFSVKTAAMWDAEALYISFVWRDPTPLSGHIDPATDSSMGWKADAAQLRVIAGACPCSVTLWGFNDRDVIRPAMQFEHWGSSERQAGPLQTNLTVYTGRPESDLGGGCFSAYRATPDHKGFISEHRIPWSALYREPGKQMTAGTTIKCGLEFLWGDCGGTASGYPLTRAVDNHQPGDTTHAFFFTNTKAWGDLTALDHSVAKPRRYVPDSVKPFGTIPIRANVPAGMKYFSLVIEDEQGRRVRNLAGGQEVANFITSGDTIEVMWDGKDDSGTMAPAGTYRVRGLAHNGIDGHWEMSFYNPGNPALYAANGTGGWGADHRVVRLLARSGTNVVLACDFSEGGFALFPVMPNFHKAWGIKQGASGGLAADSAWVYAVGGLIWSHTGCDSLNRYEAANGKPVPFQRDGKPLPLPLMFTELLGCTNEATAPRGLGLGAAGGKLALATTDGCLRLLDAESARVEKTLKADFAVGPGRTGGSHIEPQDRDLDPARIFPFAFDGRAAYYFRPDGALAIHEIASGAVQTVRLERLGRPSALALNDAGEFIVADLGPDCQVKRFSRAGKLLSTYGKQGGRGKLEYDPAGMRDMGGLTVDAAGNVWVSECSRTPRRVSVWAPDGNLKKEFIGNAAYAGFGTFIHRDDPALGYAEMNEFAIDPRTHAWKMLRTMWNPGPDRTDEIEPGSTHFDAGHVFRATGADGKERDWFVAFSNHRPKTRFFLMAREEKQWRVISAVFPLATLLHQFVLIPNRGAHIPEPPAGEWADCDRSSMIVWNDLNNDGRVQRTECEILQPEKPTAKDRWGFYVPEPILPLEQLDGDFGGLNPDFSFYTAGTWPARRQVGSFRWKPDGVRDGFKPVYHTSGLTCVRPEPISQKRADNVYGFDIPGGKTILGMLQNGQQYFLAGYDQATGECRWRYPNFYPNVHGSHRAGMPQPGLIIGALKIMGLADRCGEAGDVMMIRGNMGEDYFLTTDGLFVDRFTRDERIPQAMQPETEDAWRELSFRNVSGRGEPFCGVFSRQRDGVVRCTGPIPVPEACNVVRVEGLEDIRRFTAPEVKIAVADLVKAAAANETRLSALDKPITPYTIAKAASGKPLTWTRVKPLRIEAEGQPATCIFRAAYTETALSLRYEVNNDASPWINNGPDVKRNFKTGDCVDLKLDPTGKKADQVRVCVSPDNKGGAAVVMRPFATNAPAEEKHTYSSPVATIVFASVRVAPEVKIAAEKRESAYAVTVTIPWTTLGIKPADGMKLRGDVGFILGDAAGRIDTARVYWADKNTGLVYDEPNEATLNVKPFGTFTLE